MGLKPTAFQFCSKLWYHKVQKNHENDCLNMVYTHIDVNILGSNTIKIMQKLFYGQEKKLGQLNIDKTKNNDLSWKQNLKSHNITIGYEISCNFQDVCMYLGTTVRKDQKMYTHTVCL